MCNNINADWRPISKAPRKAYRQPHGPSLLLASEKGHMMIGYWMDFDGKTGWASIHDHQISEYGHLLTHWMPLPQKPLPGISKVTLSLLDIENRLRTFDVKSSCQETSDLLCDAADEIHYLRKNIKTAYRDYLELVKRLAYTRASWSELETVLHFCENKLPLSSKDFSAVRTVVNSYLIQQSERNNEPR